jgi:hypothetical protein
MVQRWFSGMNFLEQIGLAKSQIYIYAACMFAGG